MQELTRQDAERILERNHHGRLACYSPSHDTSYVVPISYSYHDGSIYLALLAGQKLDFLREHPRGVCFEVDEITNDETWLSVIATGVFAEIGGPERTQEELAAIQRLLHGPLRATFYERQAGDGLTLKLDGSKLQVGAIRVTTLTARQDRWSFEVDFPMQVEAAKNQ
ncbi:MAG TPA: pyridoxamine 5'-phosphate oxidase family protein [Chloroflexota bacterium]|jgi:nitroimidazol reductase NimA-like FMN-containing flavoprotein (pyridoxamine 5'-phosphate oxidase superfamily)